MPATGGSVKAFGCRGVSGWDVPDGYRCLGNVGSGADDDTCTIPIETNAGTVSWETDVVTPTDLSASYDETATLGDLFDENRVIFTLTYPDGTTGTSREFSVLDAPEYLSEAMTLTVTSDYGDTNFPLFRRICSSFRFLMVRRCMSAIPYPKNRCPCL